VTTSNAAPSPRKLATVSAYSRDILKYGRPSIEQILRAGMSDALHLALDSALLDATIGDTTRCQGLRYNIGAVGTASTATSLQEALVADLETVIGAVSAVANNGQIVLVASPKQAVALRLRPRSSFTYPIMSSSALADTVVMAIAANCLVSAIDPVPRFEVTDQGTLHCDTTPAEIVSGGGVVAAKTINLFQQDQFALRVVYTLAWALRSATGLAWLTGTKW
jgi:hypothetical protein